MRKSTTALLTPLAAFAVAGSIGTGPAQANGVQHGTETDHTRAHSAEIVTTEDAAATLDQSGVTTEAVPPATAEPQDEGTTEFRFPEDDTDIGRATPGRSDRAEGEFEYLGGIEYRSDAGGSTTWQDPEVDTTAGLVSFEVDGERTDLLQVEPVEESEEHADYDLVLTDDGADELNEVAGSDAFEEGDVLATTDDGKDC